jgi:MoaA/NifB/PqqE/SkfB family radical SAM enzyme
MAEVAGDYRAPLRAPFTVCLWLTDYCNLACKYCYAMPFSGRRMETARTLQLIEEFAALGVFDLTLAGGEPLLHPDVLEVISQSVRSGIRVGVLTNGTPLTSRMITELEARTSHRNFILQVSLDSVNPEVNDRARGKTEKVLQSLHRLRDSSLTVQLACVVHKNNVDVAHTILDEFYPFVKRFHFLNIQRTQQALRHPELLLTEAEAAGFWLRLAEHAKRFPEDLFLPSLRIQLRAHGTAHSEPEFSITESASFACESCSAGWTHINVTANFDVLGCDIAKDYTRMGNVREVAFSDVWNSPEAHAVRNAPFPACYKIRSESGEALVDHLKPELIQLARV